MSEALDHMGALHKLHGWRPDRKENMEVHVTVEDVKPAFGEWLYLVSPVRGSGREWVAAKSVRRLT